MTHTTPQTKEEFQAAMPVSGTVETFFGDFELDHCLPTKDTAQRVYDLMDHQRAAQLYLWGISPVGITRWRIGYESTYVAVDDNARTPTPAPVGFTATAV